MYRNVVGKRENITNITKYELGTIVDYSAREQTATVYTRDKTVMCKLDQLVRDYPESYTLIKQTDIDKTYSMPKLYVNYRKPRTLNAEQFGGKTRNFIFVKILLWYTVQGQNLFAV